MNTTFQFRLFVAGDTQNSSQAVANLNEICEKHLSSDCEIEIVDVFLEPKRALEDGVLMTPMLMKLGPGPSKRIVGTLSKTETVLQALGVG
ncbi:MAG: circadian clock KaiB family protein [Fimbriimonas sp.]